MDIAAVSTGPRFVALSFVAIAIKITPSSSPLVHMSPRSRRPLWGLRTEASASKTPFFHESRVPQKRPSDLFGNVSPMQNRDSSPRMNKHPWLAAGVQKRLRQAPIWLRILAWDPDAGRILFRLDQRNRPTCWLAKVKLEIRRRPESAIDDVRCSYRNSLPYRDRQQPPGNHLRRQAMAHTLEPFGFATAHESS